jgi:uncharacterized protein (DUF952 family)
MLIFHAVTPRNWKKFSDRDFYEAESLFTEGFIHASFAEQLDATLRIHHKDETRILVLAIDSELLENELRIEESRNGEKFPHVYGSINKSAIVKIVERNLSSPPA